MDGGEWCKNTDEAFPRAQKDKVMECLQTRKDRWGNQGEREKEEREIDGTFLFNFTPEI